MAESITKKYLFKITPNNKDVVINSSVLLHGYPNVTYPIPINTNDLLGYTQDTLTFKFVDTSVVSKSNEPYPTKLTISYTILKLPFYAINEEKHTRDHGGAEDGRFYFNVLRSSEHDDGSYKDLTINNTDIWASQSKRRTKYDFARFSYYPTTYDYYTDTNDNIVKSKTINHVNIEYSITVNLYWSDGKSHADELNAWNAYSKEGSEGSGSSKTNTYPLELSIVPVISDTNIAVPVGKKYTRFPQDIIAINTDWDNINPRSYIFKVFDNFKEVLRDVALLNISATFTHPKTGVSVSDYKTVTLLQSAYQGYRKGYVKILFVDHTPLEIFSPTVYPVYTISVNDEANNKVDEGLNTEYYSFNVSGNYTLNASDYTYPGIYVLDAIEYENATSVTDLDNAPSGKFNFSSILFDNYCVNKIAAKDVDAEEILNNLSNDVYSNIDAYTFLSRYDVCRKLYVNYVDTSYFQIPLKEVELGINNIEKISTTDLKLPDTSIIIKNGDNISFSGLYGALYSYYAVVNNEYYLRAVAYQNNIYYPDPDVNNKNYYFKDNTIEYDTSTIFVDCNTISSNSSISEYSGKWSNFSIKSNDSVSTLYKYCINSLLDPSTVQIPRYAVYPILSGYITMPLEIYDYTSRDTSIVNIDPTTYDIKNSIISKNGNYYVNATVLNNAKTGQLVKNLVKIPISDTDNTSTYMTWSQYLILRDLNNNNIYGSVSTSTTSNLYGSSTEVEVESSNAKATYNDYVFSSPAKLTTNTEESQVVYGVNDTDVQNKISTATIKFSFATAGRKYYYITKYLRVNGVPVSNLANTSLTSSVDPNIFILNMNEYPYNLWGTVPFTITFNTGETLNCTLVVTNDENEKHLTHYTNDGDEIGSTHASSMLLRANPKLSGNIKLVVDSDYNLYLDTFKANLSLNLKNFRKYPISAEGNYPRDIKNVFKNLPATKLFGVPADSLKAHKAYHDFNDQYETMYEYGAETNKDRLYSENMKILAPLHIGNNIPEYFTIFRYSDLFNEETYNNEPINDLNKFKSLIKDSEVVTTFDLRTHTSIGQYLNNYLSMVNNYGQCYLQFIEQDYDELSPSYRLGNNIWKGISVKRGILVDQSETTYFGSKILNSDYKNKQELFNNYIIAGFERHNLIYPNIINLEFMFNDNDMKEYSMHRYFGLYLTANEFIKYKYIISDNKTSNRVLKRYDMDGNLYTSDNIIYNQIFTNTYKDRIFYAITNNHANRIKSNIDLNSFFTNYVVNTPESNLLSMDAESLSIPEGDKSFITLHFSLPLQYGEHLKFVALNYVEGKTSYTKAGDYNKHKKNALAFNNVVYEIIASNDERLRTTDNNISPYVNTLKCHYSENTYFYRLAFYSQDLDYPNITATLSDLILRIIACIEKFETFISVSYHNNNTLAITSTYDEMYLQHIAAHNFDDFKYDYFYLDQITSNSSLYTTNKECTYSIEYLVTDVNGNINKSRINDTSTSIYEQHNDETHDWLDSSVKTGTNRNWNSYVEVMDPENIITDHISYFNENITYNMFALTNQSDYFDSYYTAFSNYEFETLGWRYNSIIKFQNISNCYLYILKDNVQDIINSVRYPLIYNANNQYDTLNVFTIESGFLKNNVYDPDCYTNYYKKQNNVTVEQEFKFYTTESCIVSSPYNTDLCIISALHDSLLPNNKIHLYNPTLVSVAVMGISNIKDINTTLDYNDSIHRETCLSVSAVAGESIKTDESDLRFLYGVMYEVTEGILKLDTRYVRTGDRFICDSEVIYASVTGNYTKEPYITAETDASWKIVDKQGYQDYCYDTSIPSLNSDNYYVNINNIENSELSYPIVPTVYCSWKSTGTYYDNNSVLDVSTLTDSYNVIGNFSENTYTPADYDTNQYITNKIDNILYVDGLYETYKECILNQDIENPIKKLLIDNTDVDTASVFYNSAIKGLEFIFSGIKFSIKLNSKIVNTYIHLEDYTNFEAFVINDYNSTKTNEMYISIKDKMILIVNHQFYIDYAHEAVNNVKSIDENNMKGYAEYSAFEAPYSIDFSTTALLGYNLTTMKKEYNGLHKSLMAAIDEHNLWSSLFALYDIPIIDTDTDKNKPLFILSMVETTSEYDDYVTMSNIPYGVGSMNDKSTEINKSTNNSFKATYGDSHPYVITKADGEYTKYAYNILEALNDMIHGKFAEYTHGPLYTISSDYTYGRETTVSYPKLYRKYLYNTDNIVLLTLQLVLDADTLKFLYTITDDGTSTDTNSNEYNTISISRNIYRQLQSYLLKIIATESLKEKLERYTKSFTDDVDIYIIPENGDIRFINNTTDSNPLMFSLTVPNQIKFNHGWFTPNTNNMVDFYVDDELRDILDVDLMLANTKIKNIHRLVNYTGNKVYPDTTASPTIFDNQVKTSSSSIINLKKNYFMIPDKSLLSSTWDIGYYRLYSDEDNYTYTDGYKTGIDDKSFFGSRCMIIQNEYILLNTWSFSTANDIYTVSTVNALHNVSSTNNKNTLIKINLNSAIYNHFINNKVFAENWNYFEDSLYTGMKNYVNNTLMRYYHCNCENKVVLYAIDTDPNTSINIVDSEPANFSSYYVYENYSTNVSVENNITVLTIVLNESTGKNIYPTVKIYK